MNDIIGICIADGSMHAVFDTGYRGTKRLVLTTATDQQETLQIDIHCAKDKSFADPKKLGQIVLENLLPLPQGETEISLMIGINDVGTLQISATDDISGEHAEFSMNLLSDVSIDELVEEASEAKPDKIFDIDTPAQVPANATLGIDPQISYASGHQTETPEELRRHRKTSFVRFVSLLGFLIVSLAVLSGLIFVIFNGLQNASSPALIQ